MNKKLKKAFEMANRAVKENSILLRNELESYCTENEIFFCEGDDLNTFWIEDDRFTLNS